jgi:hypothetical protein
MTDGKGVEERGDSTPAHERFVRCFRCGEVFPEAQLGAHRRAHRDVGPFGAVWIPVGEAEEA